MCPKRSSESESDPPIQPNKTLPSTGFRGFTIIWAGQLVSLLGTGMTQFAITIWAWQTTGVATALALVGFFTVVPQILTSPLAGAIVDRYNRKHIIILSDLAAGLATVFLLILHSSGNLQIWHLYIASAFSGAFGAFQFPAYSATVSTMLHKEQYGRANGMIALAEAASGIIAPIAAGLLLNKIGIGGIMVFDVITFIVAIGALFIIYIPQPHLEGEVKVERVSLWEDSFFGFKYIFKRKGLLGLLLVFLLSNFIFGFSFTLFSPMILSRTGDDTLILGAVQSAFGVGGVVGGVIMSAWGGPKKKVNGVIFGMAAVSLITCFFGIGRDMTIWAPTAFLTMALIPILNGSSQSIWQSKVPPEMQGRVFSTRAIIARFANPISMAISGPLADWVFEPAMMPGGNFVSTFGWLVGTGPGAGIAVLFVIMGILGFVITIAGYSVRSIRDLESIIPDYDTTIG